MLKRRLSVLPLLLLYLSTSSAVAIDGYQMLDAKACRQLVDDKAILPMTEIVARTEVLAVGQILDAVLLKKSPMLMYQIEHLGTDGVVRTLYIDASQGTLKPDFDNGRLELDADSSR